MARRVTVFAWALLAAAVAGNGQEPAAAVVRVLQLQGVTIYDRATVLRIVRLHEGDRLWRPAPAVAASLEERYHAQGYVAARVSGAYDAASETLTLSADEGHLAEVAVPLAGAAGESARRALALKPGALLRRQDLMDALDRLESASGGALRGSGDPPYALDSAGDGVRVAFLLERHPTRLELRPIGPGLVGIYNRVDGFAPFLGATLHHRDLTGYDDLQLYARASYGFASQHARFALGGRRAFGRLSAGYEFHDLTDTDDAFRAGGFEESLGLLLSRSSFRDYFRRRGHEAYAVARPNGRLEIGLDGRRDQYESLDVTEDWSVFRRSAAPRPNPPVTGGRTQSLVASVRWSTSALYDDAQAASEAFPLRDLYAAAGPNAAWRAQATYELASRAAPDGDVGFRRLIASLHGDRPLTTGHSLRTRLMIGLGAGQLPAQKTFALGGLGTLRGYSWKELAGDNMLLASAEWAFEPEAPWPGLVAFYDGGAAWTRGVAGRGWVQDVGLGLELRVRGRMLVRLDAAFALDRTESRDRVRLSARLQRPF